MRTSSLIKNMSQPEGRSLGLFFKPDDEVVGILPLDAEQSGLCSVVVTDEYNLVQKPEKVSWVEAAAVIKDGLRAYTALHTLARMAAGQTVRVLDEAGAFGVLAIQLAHYHGVKVLATASSPEDQKFLEELRPSVGVQESLLGKLFMAAISSRSIHSGYHILISLKSNLFLENSHSAYISLKCLINVNLIVCKHLSVSLPSARVIRVWDSKQDLVDSCLEETGGLGVDIIIDSGVRLCEEEPEAQRHCPHKHDLLTLLSVGGHWVNTEQHLQLDPPDSHILFLKAASLSFLNDEVWTTSLAKQG
ncbi:quinone oxidoreductase-like protein 1 [Cyprinus carpio]|uniref:Quinone oxidoreductase-like protein 1 n=1 Tax=Cyprinus carpio TaxID=7962 RepID=A0A9Q9YBW0_CYPCA|nr:quinone oxidoreductase-like protein 1 [Cyprinus carpio]XP_042617360.1 quinone oxidoreductase-like protein 1 [Cyprinus carpio]